MNAQVFNRSAADIGRLVNPRSIAIIGASDRAGSLGSRTVSNLLDHSDFRGETYLINPGRTELRDRPCYANIRDLPAAPDVALLVVPAAQTLTALQDAAERGVSFAMVFTSGFGEMGEEGRAAEAEMLRISRQSGMRIYGPNSPGLCNLNTRLGMMFSPSYRVDQRPGPIGLATQGGGIGRCFLQAMERGVGVGLWASTGNEVDLTVADFIRYMADADDITTIATAMEGVKDGQAFIDAALYAAERNKPVVALKVGRSEYGARAVASHTGSISGAVEVNSAAFRQAGVVEVDDLDELIDTAALFARKRPTGAEKVAVYGFSGGACALAADAVGEARLEMATFAPETLEQLQKTLPSYAAFANPVDATSDILTNSDIAYDSLKAVADDPSVGVILYPFPCDYAELTQGIADDGVRTQGETDTPIVAVWTSDRLGAGWSSLVEGGLVPSRSVKRAALAIRRWIERGRWETQTREAGWRPLPSDSARPEARFTLNESAAKSLLARAGVSTPSGVIVHSANEARRVAELYDVPLVAKIVSADIAHKSDVGGVIVGLSSPDQSAAGYEQIISAVGEAAPRAQIDGVLLEKMAPAGGTELLIGVTRDPIFGHVMTVGLGGVFVELFRDVSRRLLPLTPAMAREMLMEPKCAALLTGYRGKPAVDIDAVVEILLAVSQFVSTHADALEELELNPVWVGPKGQGALALDALLVSNTPIEAQP